MTTRQKLFTQATQDADLDLAGFAPKTPDRTKAPVSPDFVKTVAEEGGFPSREPTVVYVRYKTGRTVLLGARITPRAHDQFHAILAEERARYDRGEITHKATLGQIVEDALAALVEKRAKAAGKG